jgi:hypothetical protein
LGIEGIYVKFKLIVLPLLVWFAVAAGFSESFRNPVRIPTATDPFTVLTADLNGDGRLDILWTAAGSSLSEPWVVHTLLAQAGGGFVAGPVLALPAHTSPYCRVADETRDGTPDLVCVEADQFAASVWVYPGNGDGSFSRPTDTPLPSSQANYWAPVLGSTADFNGDGVPDLVVGDGLNQRAYVLLGAGDGTFTVVTQNAHFPLYQSGDSYQAVDVNGDRHLDLLFSNGAVLLGDGTGQFKPGPGSSFAGYGLCTFGKFAGEPNIDAACGQDLAVGGDIVGGTQLLIYHGNGDGSFNQTPIKTITYGDRTNEYNGYGTFRTPIAVLDLNGDGIPDILADAGDGLTVLLGQKGLGFTYPAHYATGYDPLSSFLLSQFTWQTADLNRDGLPDLIEAGPNGVYVTYGRPDGVFDTAPAYELAQVIGYETVADFNEDGIPDIAVTGDQAIELSLGKGDGSFEYRTPLPNGVADFSTPLSAANAHIVHGDFNGDHHQDILAVGSSAIYQYNDYILFGHGDGTFSAPVLVSDSSLIYPEYYWPQVFDFNHDGKDDLFTYDANNLYVALSKGDGSFKTVTTALSAAAIASTLQTQPAIADLNGDGKLDAIFGGAANAVFFKGHGDGSFDATGVKLAIPAYKGVAAQGSAAVAVGDFDGDGHKDIALLTTSGVLFVYFGKGGGAFAAGVPAAAFNRSYGSLNAADLNKDGLDDFVLRSGGGNAVSVVHSLAGRKFGPEVNYYAGAGLADLAIVDLNGDGFPDLVFGNGGSSLGANSVTVLMNLGDSAGVTGELYALAEPSNTASPFQLVASLVAPDQSKLTGSVSFFIDGLAVGSAALADNQASLTVSHAYSAGLHSLKATWAGNKTFAALTLAGKHQITAGYPTSASIVTNYNPVPLLNAVIFSAVVQSTSGTPAGSVALLDGKTTLAKVVLTGGAAAYTTSGLSAGTHTIIANFLPATGWASSSASLQQAVSPINATTTLTVTPTIIYAFQPVTATVTVESPGPVPTGTVTFSGDYSSLGTKTLVNGAAAFSTSFSYDGFHEISAQYSGDKNYNPGYAYVGAKVLINPTATALNAAPNPATAGQTVSLTSTVTSNTVKNVFATGSVQFMDNGGSIGTAQLVSGVASIKLSSLAVGKHPLVASYLGVSGFGASQSATYTLVIAQAPSSTALSASPNPATAGATVTFKAAVTGPRQPTGTVVFKEGAKPLSQAIDVDYQGVASFSTSALAVGTHTIVAVYSGDPNLNTSTSKPLQVKIVPKGGS